jgi:regulator of replication initiation timing
MKSYKKINEEFIEVNKRLIERFDELKESYNTLYYSSSYLTTNNKELLKENGILKIKNETLVDIINNLIKSGK